MLDLVFTMILAGCGDGAAECTVLERQAVTVSDLAACEVILENRMIDAPEEWPVISGLCVPGTDIVGLPDGWRVADLVVAGR